MTMLYVFDLDGTLVDSRADIVRSVNATLVEFGRAALPSELVASYVGHGAKRLIRRAFGDDAPDDLVDRAFDFFLPYYRAHLLVETEPYPGVEEALREIGAEGHPMAVLTNKPELLSFEMIEGLGWSDFFFRIYGGDSLEERKPHPLGLELIMEEAGATRDQTVMVGDSAVDIETARNAGVLACGVSYGIQPEGFEAYPPDLLVDSLTELPVALARHVEARR